MAVATRPGTFVIQIENLGFAYRRTPLYSDFHLTLGQPGVYGLFGRNGSGKSTLLKLIAGLLFPQQGRIQVQGREPRHRHPDLLASIYLVPEEFHLPDLSAAQLLRTHAGFYPRFCASAFADHLEVFELPRDRPFAQMSLGEKKKATMAFALATFTPLLLLDEPTNGLDILGRDQFKTIVARPEQRDRIIVVSTHQAHDLESIMNHVLFVDGARLALSASMAELSTALRMGIAADAAALAAIEDVVHQETLGEQHAWVAANRTGAPGAVHMELLYKALSRNKQGVLDALAQSRGETADV